ncbi:MAG: NAD(P)-dependent alcohol dehydrogenase [Nitrospinota bacterium]|nr:NAD(P)-dependent alcohol dehydrogenase [Nitrospinota bacterium]
MKAIVYTEYGPPEVLQLKDVEKPVPRENQVLIKIHAASINSMDWDMLTGKPTIYRLLFGLMVPKHPILGCDVAGVVEAVGPKVTRFEPRAEVYGDLSLDSGFGGFAEYVCANENLLAPKPAGMTFQQAAAIPQAGLLALAGFHFHGEMKPGQKMLFNGAGGGAGTFAVQMAKSLGADVTCVDSAVKLDTLRSLGADHVVDYAQEDFTKNGERYDLILDVVANRSIYDYKRSLNSHGSFGVIGGSIFRLLQIALLGPVMSRIGDKKMGLVIHNPSQEDYAHMNELFEGGEVKPVIDRLFPLRETPEAFRYFGEGRFKGKIVITMGHNG